MLRSGALGSHFEHSLYFILLTSDGKRRQSIFKVPFGCFAVLQVPDNHFIRSFHELAPKVRLRSREICHKTWQDAPELVSRSKLFRRTDVLAVSPCGQLKLNSHLN